MNKILGGMFVGLEEAVKEYISKRPKSMALFDRAVKVMPGGASHAIRTWGLPTAGAYPFYAKDGKGAYLTDVDGFTYIDYWQGHLVNVLGHNNERVKSAMRRALDLGPNLGLATEAEIKLAELIAEIVPCVEQLKFGVSGTEATMYAVRIARTYTNRKIIAKCEGGWHGSSTDLNWGVHKPMTDSEGNPLPDSAGLPDTMNVVTIPYNDIEETRKIIRNHATDLAGVIVEPILGGGGLIPADPKYLEMLREETTNTSACLIFDEIITNFNYALGGAQEYFGIIPDLVTLGKTMGGGVHISAVGGPTEIMDVTNALNPGEKYEKVGMGGGTFSSHPVTLLAAYEALSILKEEKDEIYPRLRDYGDRMRSQIRDEIIPKTNLHVKCTGTAHLIGIHFLTKDVPLTNARTLEENAHKIQKLEYFVRLLNQGVHTLHGLGRLCTEHGESEIGTTIDAIEAAVKSIEQSS